MAGINQKIFGMTVKDIRVCKQMSMTDLTVKTGISASYISEVESGKRNVSFDIICSIIEGLGCTHVEFFERYQSIKHKKKDD